MKIEQAVFLVLVLFCSLVVVIPDCFGDDIKPAIEIRIDGSVYPNNSPIHRNGDTYTITEDFKIVGKTAICILKDNVVLDGAGHTLKGTGANSGVFIGSTESSAISTQNVTVKNLHLTQFSSGIKLEFTSKNMISNCTLIDINYGIGIGVHADYNQIIGNQLLQTGIILGGESVGNIIENNVIKWTGTGNQGMLVYHSQNHTIRQNTVTNGSVHLYGDEFNVFNNKFVYSSVQLLGNFHTFKNNQFVNATLCVDGLRTSQGLNSIDTSNTINGKPIYYLVDQKDKTISGDAGKITLVRCTNITIKNVSIIRNPLKAVYLVNTNNSVITQNTVSFNSLGIELLNSENNTLSCNTISENNRGIRIISSRLNQIVENIFSFNNGFAMEFIDLQANNTIYHNNFVDNHVEPTDLQVSMPGVGFINIANANFWDKNGQGNFWSEYTTRYPNATETNQTGIGDTPFFINENNIDQYPLLEPVNISQNDLPTSNPWAAGGLFPEPNSVDVPLDAVVSISFGRPPSTVELTITPQVPIKNQTIEHLNQWGSLHTFYFNEWLEPSTTYVVTLLYDEALNTTKTWTFTTTNQMPNPPPVEKDDAIDHSMYSLDNWLVIIVIVSGLVIGLFISKIREHKTKNS